MPVYLDSTFSKKNAETDAKFISYREVIEKFSSESGDSIHDVALFLKREGAYKNYAIWLNGPERTTVWDEGGVLIATLLDQTITTNEIAVSFDEYGNELGDPDTHGWWRNEFLFNLAVEFGLFTPPSLDSPTEHANNVHVSNSTDIKMLEKLHRAEQDTADARSQVEALKIQLTDAQRSIDELRRLVGDQSGIALHNTHLMRIALEVQRANWTSLDRSKSKQEVIIADLMEKHGLSKPEAIAVERVACPFDRSPINHK